jgi:hypothetical protein
MEPQEPLAYQGDRFPVRLGSHLFVLIPHLRIRIRGSSPLFALIRKRTAKGPRN